MIYENNAVQHELNCLKKHKFIIHGYQKIIQIYSKDGKAFLSYSQYQGCRWPGEEGSQGISK